MGSTNKTQYLELPQWIGTDKPTFLGDFNDAFLKIDNGYNTINGTATTAGAQAGQAVEDASSALSKVESVEDVANTANTNANQALTIANNANTTANNANTAVNNLTPRVTALENSQENLSLWIGGAMSAWSELTNDVGYAYYNSTLKILNLYGKFVCKQQTISNSQTLFTLPNSILSYFSDISTRTIYAACSVRKSDGTPLFYNFSLNNSGNIMFADGFNGAGSYISDAGFNLMLNVSNW